MYLCVVPRLARKLLRHTYCALTALCCALSAHFLRTYRPTVTAPVWRQRRRCSLAPILSAAAAPSISIIIIIHHYDDHHSNHESSSINTILIDRHYDVGIHGGVGSPPSGLHSHRPLHILSVNDITTCYSIKGSQQII
jgi:hypothetical protein